MLGSVMMETCIAIITYSLIFHLFVLYQACDNFF